ncbi:MAG TPA: beta-propeller domain-containing protein [Methylomirabilota bacterium]|nr:beta-propeller domain-containing protein [Methylomirabilota bacterium]
MVRCSKFIITLLLVLSSFCARAVDLPKIEQIRAEKGELVVVASIPSGLKKLTLLSRLKADGSAWEPRAVARVDGAGGRVTFRVPNSDRLELLTVKGEAADALPAFLYEGTNAFLARGNGAMLMNGSEPEGFPTGAPSAGNSRDATREVVEADIYKVRGDTLYLFNQRRGLQVIDISNPDAPHIRGTLKVGGFGEDLYLLPGNEVVLLAQEGCYYWGGNSEVMIVNAGTPTPTVQATVSVEGAVTESRLVGTALYVASTSYRQIRTGDAVQYENGTWVTSIDLAAPANPVIRSKKWFPGTGHVVSATDKFFFVCLQDYRFWDNAWSSRTTIKILDCSAPDGTLVEKGSVFAYGAINDKFKLNLSGDVLTAVSFRWGANTEVETFSLADAANPVKLGSLTVIKNEQLFATRFDGNTLYVVTFQRIDPLWVIDLSNSARPSIVGELEVPGWSTFIHPMGDRLLALGIDNDNGQRVALSLFDVSNKAKPTLASKVTLDQYSWTEGNYNEKAFKVMEEAGLILLPYTGSATNSFHNRVQLVDFSPDALRLRGFISHELQARRAFLHKDRVLSFSARELIAVTVDNRDNPQVTANLRLSWPVDRVFAHGDFLVQVENGGLGRPRLHVAARTAPSEILATHTLSNTAPIVAAVARGSRLYVAQQAQSSLTVPGSTNGYRFEGLLLSAYTLSALPALEFIGAATGPEQTEWPAQDYHAVWPKEDLLVLVGQTHGGWWWRSDAIFAGAPAGRGWGMPWWGGSSGRTLLAFQTRDTGPSFASSATIEPTNSYSTPSLPLALNGMIYQSHSVAEAITNGTYTVVETKYRAQVVTKTNVTTSRVETSPGVFETRSETNVFSATEFYPEGLVTNTYPRYLYATRHLLNVVDYENPSAPTVRRPVNIPGELRGMAANGAAIYTVGQRFSTNQDSYEYWLDVSAYDGVSAFLVDSLKMDAADYLSAWDGVDGILIPSMKESQLKRFELDVASAKLKVTDAEALPPVHTEVTAKGSRFVTRSDNELRVWAVDAAGELSLLRSGRSEGCHWIDITRSDVDSANWIWAPLGEYGVARVPTE